MKEHSTKNRNYIMHLFWISNIFSTDIHGNKRNCLHSCYILYYFSTVLLLGDNMCFYGVCYYCKPAEAACADGTKMEGSLTLWLPVHMSLRNWRHPYQRTYRDGHSAR